MRRGFKTEARKLALELRAELGVDAYGQFDPYALADEYGIPIFRLGNLGEDLAARLDWDDEQVADAYDVSVQLARMRMNYSGARKVVANKRAYLTRSGRSLSEQANS